MEVYFLTLLFFVKISHENFVNIISANDNRITQLATAHILMQDVLHDSFLYYSLY